LTDTDVVEAAQLLSELEPGWLPEPIFQAVARLVVLPIVEVVPLRRADTGEIEILLLERRADDPVWPGMLHTPGTVVRASDSPGSFDDALGRILDDELGNIGASEPVWVKNILHHSGRGMEASQIYWIEVEGEPKVGTYYRSSQLPERLVQTQLDFIPDAVEHFKRSRGSLR
jgi:hypothetical protein